MRILFIVCFVIPIQYISAQSKVAFRSQTQQELFNNTVFVLYGVLEQSNGMGRATAQRSIQILGEAQTPTDVYIYYKSDYSTTDNGTFQQLVEGSANTSEPINGATGMHGAYGMIARRIADVSPNKVYIIETGRGGIALQQGQTSPDWSPASVGGMYDISMNRYFKIAYPKIVADNPGKTIKVIMLSHQGETDATNNTSTTNYGTNLSNFWTTTRAAHPALTNALLIITYLYFDREAHAANEDAINATILSFKNSNSTNTRVIDVSSFHRKQDLTTIEKGGITTAGSDDQHQSYLGQQFKATQSYTYIHDFYFPFL